MSSDQVNAGVAQGNTQAKTEELMDSAKSTASAAQETAQNAAGSDEAQAQRSKEDDAGILQRTGEQMANMAQGAIDGVKNTLGMGEKK